MRRFCCTAVLALPTVLFAQPCVVQGTAPPRPAITGLAFAAFQVDSQADADKFYGKELGLQPVAGPEQSTFYPVNSKQWIETRVAGQTQRDSSQLAVGLFTADATDTGGSDGIQAVGTDMLFALYGADAERKRS